ncbi:unnamed protein product [Lactuca saligna]|uniref:Uncharacterized protein n=1 Tax=Lactuca saligna TaxID=75948 RepID=A0AA36A2U3_LACSI|nr:unnamed protein product [Lactuca saligna]
MVQPRSPCQILLIIVLCSALCWRPLMSSMLETVDGPMAMDNRENTDPKNYYCCKSFNRPSYTCSYDLDHLVEEVKKQYPSQSDIVLSIVFFDKHAKEHCFIELDNDESFMVMLNMYNEEKEVIIYVTTEKLRYNPKPFSCQNQVNDELDDENETDSVCPSQESYHSLHSSDNEYKLLNYGETYAYSKLNPFMKVNSKFPSVIAFRRALNHYALTN